MSYEKEVKDLIESKDEIENRLKISMFRYFWQASPLSSRGQDSIPRFFRNIQVFKNLSENELRILSQHFHRRSFKKGETIFEQGDLGVGFYLIFIGSVDIFVTDEYYDESKETHEEAQDQYVITLEKGEYFGELALLQNNSVRSASAMAIENTELLGLFKPDFEELVQSYPVVATKVLQSLSLIVTKRLFSLTNEVKRLKCKLAKYENQYTNTEPTT